MTNKNSVDKIVELLTQDNESRFRKAKPNLMLGKILGFSKPWYTKSRKEDIWKRSPILRFLDNSLLFRILLSLLLAYIVLFVVSFLEKKISCLSLECLSRELWALIAVNNIEGFSITSAAILYLVESRDRKRKSQYDAWQVIDIAEAGKRKKSDARLKAIEDLNAGRVSLRDQTFCGIDLQGINLYKGNLQGTDFNSTNLSHSNLKEALLVMVNFKNADLVASNLELANLNSACLQGADLTISNLKKASMRQANMETANLRYAKLQKADLRNANLKNSNFSGANLEGANLAFADVQEAFLLGTKLRQVELSHANVTGAVYADKNTPLEIFHLLQSIHFNYFGLEVQDFYTTFPEGFDPQKAGMVKVESRIQQITSQFKKPN
jgi:uncharacterized protein YjbI with pentapeptide repeats